MILLQSVVSFYLIWIISCSNTNCVFTLCRISRNIQATKSVNDVHSVTHSLNSVQWRNWLEVFVWLSGPCQRAVTEHFFLCSGLCWWGRGEALVWKSNPSTISGTKPSLCSVMMGIAVTAGNDMSAAVTTSLQFERDV